MPIWTPTQEIIAKANITPWMKELNLPDVATFHRWTCQHYQDFWAKVINTLPIQFHTAPLQICDLNQGVESPNWFPQAKLNISDSCFNADPEAIALIYYDQDGRLSQMSYSQLAKLVNRICHSLIALGAKPGDAIAIAMPMNHLAVASYLAIIRMAGVVVSIADSFSSDEMRTRLTIANTKYVITQDKITRNGKSLLLYDRVKAATQTTIIVTAESIHTATDISLRKQDQYWDDFLSAEQAFDSVACEPMSTCNILFSSGTTAAPKAIPWNHTTPIKAASDAYFHQNIQAGDILCWPTNLGWMMGPWVIFAALINRATIALYTDAPKDRDFGLFVQNTAVTMLGVVPTLVAYWRQSHCMEGLNWDQVKVFSSSGECSNENDMQYLMTLAGNKPIIEYCGGTEIGGAYVSSTVVQPNKPSQFSTPTMGSDFAILDDSGQTATVGEVAIIPPALGLSTTLLNADHHHVYFDNMPVSASGIPLRRHGDQIERLSDGYYRILGRVDDTMNLGGIKVSAAEIERVVAAVASIIEVAAIANSPPGNGPSQLIIYAVSKEAVDKTKLMADMQKQINLHLNPLFRIHDVVLVGELPKTASNKIMRRLLRDSINS